MTKKEVLKILNDKKSSKGKIVKAMSKYWKAKGKKFQQSLDDFFEKE